MHTHVHMHTHTYVHVYMFLCVNIIEEAEGGSEQQDMLTKQRN